MKKEDKIPIQQASFPARFFIRLGIPYSPLGVFAEQVHLAISLLPRRFLLPTIGGEVELETGGNGDHETRDSRGYGPRPVVRSGLRAGWEGEGVLSVWDFVLVERWPGILAGGRACSARGRTSEQQGNRGKRASGGGASSGGSMGGQRRGGLRVAAGLSRTEWRNGAGTPVLAANAGERYERIRIWETY
ncbi:unnamed protein product [Urochloa humidicola]